MNNPASDAGIPLLTEVIPHHQSAPASGAAPEPANLVPASSKNGSPEVRRISEWDEEQWRRMESEIRERILYQLLERVDAMLEQRVRDSLADVLQLAVSNLADEIRSGLRHTLKEVVTRAVSQEITRLKTTKT